MTRRPSTPLPTSRNWALVRPGTRSEEWLGSSLAEHSHLRQGTCAFQEVGLKGQVTGGVTSGEVSTPPASSLTHKGPGQGSLQVLPVQAGPLLLSTPDQVVASQGGDQCRDCPLWSHGPASRPTPGPEPASALQPAGGLVGTDTHEEQGWTA